MNNAYIIEKYFEIDSNFIQNILTNKHHMI